MHKLDGVIKRRSDGPTALTLASSAAEMTDCNTEATRFPCDIITALLLDEMKPITRVLTTDLWEAHLFRSRI